MIETFLTYWSKFLAIWANPNLAAPFMLTIASALLIYTFLRHMWAIIDDEDDELTLYNLIRPHLFLLRIMTAIDLRETSKNMNFRGPEVIIVYLFHLLIGITFVMLGSVTWPIMILSAIVVRTVKILRYFRRSSKDSRSEKREIDRKMKEYKKQLERDIRSKYD